MARAEEEVNTFGLRWHARRRRQRLDRHCAAAAAVDAALPQPPPPCCRHHHHATAEATAAAGKEFGQCGNDRPGFDLLAVTQKVARNCEQITIKGSGGYKSNASPFFLFFSESSPILKFECREWSFVLIPDRSAALRLICQCCCFKSWINAFSFIALKFKPLLAFSTLLYDLLLRGSRRATFQGGLSVKRLWKI